LKEASSNERLNAGLLLFIIAVAMWCGIGSGAGGSCKAGGNDV
jgi:hypothetical protein